MQCLIAGFGGVLRLIACTLSPTLLSLVTDEIDAIGTKRYDSHSGGEREIQRTMLELLNQMDGFDALSEVKVGYMTYFVTWLECMHAFSNMSVTWAAEHISSCTADVCITTTNSCCSTSYKQHCLGWCCEAVWQG